MTWIVPRWVLVLLLTIGLVALVVGFSVEQSRWAAERPFSINLLSSVAGFSASLAFASMVVNRLSRRQYWSAELDRRTRATMTVEVAIRSLMAFFRLPSIRPVDSQLRELALELQTGASAEWDECATRCDAYDALRASVAETTLLEVRLSFLSDGELIYRTDRLSRKWLVFEEAVAFGSFQEVDGRPTQELLNGAIGVAEALLSVREWVHNAPDRKMRAAVRSEAFRSDLG